MTERDGVPMAVGGEELGVIVVNFNAGAFLTDCVDAVLADI